MRLRSSWRVRVPDWRNRREAAELAREHRLRLGEAGANHQLRCGKDLGVGCRVGPLLQQNVDIRPQQMREARGEVAGVGLRVDDLPEHGLGLRSLAVAGEITGEAGPRVEQGCGAGIARLEHRNSLAVQAVSLRIVVLRRGDRAEVAGDWRAHPRDRLDLPVAHGRDLCIGASKRFGGGRWVAGQAQCGAAQLKRLRIEDLGLFGRQKFVRFCPQLLA